MHFILRGLSGKHVVTDTMRNDWVYVVYNIFTEIANVVNLLEVLWKDFRKFVVKRKLNEIPCHRFWVLSLKRLYPIDKKLFHST